MNTNLANLNSKWKDFLYWLNDRYITDILLSNNISIDILSGSIFVDGQETDDNICQFIEIMNDQKKQELEVVLSFDGDLKQFEEYLNLLVTDFDKHDVSFAPYCKFLVANYNFFNRFNQSSMLKLRHSSVTSIDISLKNIQRQQWTSFMIVLMNYYLKSEGATTISATSINIPDEIRTIFSKYANNLRIIKQGYDHVFILVSNMLGELARGLPDVFYDELKRDLTVCTGRRIISLPESSEEVARLFVDSWYQFGALPPDTNNKVLFRGVPEDAFKSDVLFRLKNDITQFGYIESIPAFGAFCALAVSLDKNNYNKATKCYNFIIIFNLFCEQTFEEF